MSRKRSRAERRHHVERIKRRVARYDKLAFATWAGPTQPRQAPSAKEVGKLAAAHGTCSCCEPWGPEGTRAQERRRARREIDEQLA